MKIHNWIFSLSENDLWPSCRDHQKRLLAFYKKSFKNSVNVFKAERKFDYFFPSTFLKNFLSPKCLRVLVLSPQINLSALVKFVADNNLQGGQLILHVYGNIWTLQKDLIFCVEKLKEFQWQVKIVCPSRTLEKNLHEMFGTKTGIHTIPLFVSRFKKVKNSREGSAVTLGYFGRIAKEKNLHTLLMAFKNPEIYNHFSLEIAGRFDNHVYDNSILNFESHYFFYLSEIYKSLPAAAKRKIHFWGNLNQEEKQNLMKEIDVMVSLSTFYGEVYSFSSHEALHSEMKILLSRWGGHRDFELGEAFYVNVSRGKNGEVSIDQTDLHKKLLNLPTATTAPFKYKKFHNEIVQINKQLDELLRSKNSIKKMKPKILSKRQWNILFSR